mmetsp:Transcript_36241/g.77286  ORF Transcript_36241/g.77286 Transcript_36241/m.77286 type:complete len:296 (-) Transcript_36241:247-1134(-)
MAKQTQKQPRGNKSSSGKGNGSRNAASQSSASQKFSSNSDDGFPPRLLRSYQIKDNDASRSSALEVLVPNAVFVARHALSSNECQDWINYAEEDNRWDAVSHPATKWIAHRECGRIQKNDCSMAHRLYQRIENIVQNISPHLDIFDRASLLSNEAKCNSIRSYNNQPTYQPVTCNPNLRLYKYTKGQWFGRHVDGTNKIDLPGAHVKEAQTEITVLFYLSPCRGGATRFHLPQGKRSSGGKRKKGGGGSEGVAFAPEEGAVLLHVHGDRCLEHEAEPVLEGVKYVLRTDIVYGIV